MRCSEQQWKLPLVNVDRRKADREDIQRFWSRRKRVFSSGLLLTAPIAATGSCSQLAQRVGALSACLETRRRSRRQARAYGPPQREAGERREARRAGRAVGLERRARARARAYGHYGGEWAALPLGALVAVARARVGRICCWCVKIRRSTIILVCKGQRDALWVVLKVVLWRGAGGESSSCRSIIRTGKQRSTRFHTRHREPQGQQTWATKITLSPSCVRKATPR